MWSLPLIHNSQENTLSCRTLSTVLQTGIEHAQRDITIASLYLGTAEGREAELAQALAAAASKPAGARPRITILADALRCTRLSKGAAGTPWTFS